MFAALVYPSREGLAEYLAYRQEVEGARSSASTPDGPPTGWTPILYDADDDFPRSVAALRRSDVLLVNPIRDGLNLVAKEGPLLNDRDGVLVLSTEAGAWAELGDAGALGGQPVRRRGHRRRPPRRAGDGPPTSGPAAPASLRTDSGRRTPADWLDEQLEL